MAAMTTVLKEFSDNGNSRTYELVGNTVQAPKLVIQRRKVASNAVTGVAELQIDVVTTTTDSADLPLSSKIVSSFTIRYPAAGKAADVDANVAILLEILSGDEAAAAIDSLGWLIASSN